MQNYVFQIDADKRPLDMIPPARARKLQAKGKSATFRSYPYTVVHQRAIDSPNTKEYILKID
ncbi:MAG: HNH endonuclease, partial [Desulfobulbaceae bacterium]|nr:HNH endonuclease [Desulfobulbaceae bacterium]